MSNLKKATPSLNKTIQTELDTLVSTASKIRYLDSQEFSRGDISRILDIRYQWVRNVLITPLKTS